MHLRFSSTSLSTTPAVATRRSARVRMRVARGSALVLLALVAAACSGGDEPAIPTALAGNQAGSLSGAVNASVGSVPSVTLTDQRGRGLSNVLVLWRVTAGGGRVTNDSSRTDGNGLATSGGWVLGVQVGPQTLTASVAGLNAITFNATAQPGAPFQYVRNIPEPQSGVVGQPASVIPALQVQDQWGNPVPNVAVTFTPLPNSGSVTGPAQRTTDASGNVSVEGWVLGTQVGNQVLRAQAQGLSSFLFFTARAAAGPPVTMIADAPTQQDGVAQQPVPVRPAVRVRDEFNNPVGGVTVTFTPGNGSGSVAGGTQVTDSTNGRATVTSWTLGSAPAQELVATSPQLPGESVEFRADVVETLMKIEVRFLGPEPSSAVRTAVESSIARWRNVIVGRVGPTQLNFGPNPCGADSDTPEITELVDGLVIFARIDSIDGPGSILGRAGPCAIASQSQLPVLGYMEFDVADIDNIAQSPARLSNLFAHEIGHILGVGTLWNFGGRTLLVGGGSDDPYYRGDGGRSGFALIGGGSYSGTPVPVANVGGQGTRDAHWRTNVLIRELMIGQLQAGAMPLSALTVGSMADLGYQIRLAGAEQFSITPTFTSMTDQSSAQSLHDDIWPTTIWSVDTTGLSRILRRPDPALVRQMRARDAERRAQTSRTP